MNRWKRYGKDHLYVNDGNGEALGYLDLATNEVVPAKDGYRLVVREAAAAYLHDG